MRSGALGGRRRRRVEPVGPCGSNRGVCHATVAPPRKGRTSTQVVGRGTHAVARVVTDPARPATSHPDEPGGVGAVIRTTCPRGAAPTLWRRCDPGGVTPFLVPKWRAAQAHLKESICYLVAGRRRPQPAGVTGPSVHRPVDDFGGQARR